MESTTARALLYFFCLVLYLCCRAPPCLCAEAAAGGYAARAAAVDEGGARLRAQLAAIAAAGDGDVRNLDVYARCDILQRRNIDRCVNGRYYRYQEVDTHSVHQCSVWHYILGAGEPWSVETYVLRLRAMET